MLAERRPMMRSIAQFAIAAAALAVVSGPVLSDTLEGALAQAYQNNPSLNAQRAALRATDEGVGIALSGYRPRVTATVTHGASGVETGSRAAATGNRTGSFDALNPQGYGVTATQTLY